MRWGLIKHVPSATDPNGDEFFNTTRHSNFICLGAHEKSSVCIHINKRLTASMPRMLNNIIIHDDICMISIETASGWKNIINIYNRSKTNDALHYLADKYESLPEIFCMAGDFNLHSSRWGRTDNKLYLKGISDDKNNVTILDEIIEGLRLDILN